MRMELALGSFRIKLMFLLLATEAAIGSLELGEYFAYKNFLGAFGRFADILLTVPPIDSCLTTGMSTVQPEVSSPLCSMFRVLPFTGDLLV